METKSNNYRAYYFKQLEEANKYQDFVANVLLSHLGIVITNYKSKHYQMSRGENRQGLEIKFDKRFRDTGNLYIEVAEKSDPSNANFIISGIYRLDNTWLYSIGDYETIYIFSKKQLVRLHRAKKYREVSIDTSKGFLIPIIDANILCDTKFEPNKEYQIKAIDY